jgi:selenocysteine lyase/cysteine desulfurase/tRNA(Ile)-lysidine synthase TilS/MesJ
MASFHRTFCDELEEENPGGLSPPSGSLDGTVEGVDDIPEENKQLVRRIHDSVIGHGHSFDGPFGDRKVLYADWTASGRALSFVEEYIQTQVLPMYGNTHTTTSVTGLQSTCFRHEARQLIAQSLNCNTKEDVVLFVGNGCTGAVNKLVSIFGLNKPPQVAESDEPESAEDRRAVVFVGPHEHHSNLLPWRESCADVVAIGETSEGVFDVDELKAQLKKYSRRPLKIGSFAYASNLTGIIAPVNTISAIVHRAGGLVFWDCATAGPYLKIDMNPVVAGDDRPYVYKDGVFLSPHKMVGGPGTPGILVVKKRWLSNAVPAEPGGGTVFFVTDRDHRYLSNREEREEGGTPNIVGSARAGLVFHLKQRVGTNTIHALETRNWDLVKTKLRNAPAVHVLGSTAAKRLPILSFLVACGGEGRFLHYNFVCALLNDVYGIQSRGGCQCAGPYGQALLGIKYENAQKYETECIEKNEFLRPGFSRVSFPYFLSVEEVNFILDAILAIASYGWKLLPLYRFHHKTGEWKHRSRMTKFAARKWLSHALDHVASIEDGGGSKSSETDSEWMARTKREAAELFEDAVTRIRKEGRSLFVDQTQLAEPMLRWCVLPSEASDALASQIDLSCTLSSSSHHAMAVIPRRYDSNSQEESKESTAPMEKMTQVTDVVSSRKRRHEQDADVVPGKKKKKEKYPLRSAVLPTAHDGNMAAKAASSAKAQAVQSRAATLFPTPPKTMLRTVGMAMAQWEMVKPGDRLLLGLSGGKDSLALLHVLHNLQKRSPIPFELAAATVDPGTDAFDPSPLKAYMKSLGIPYFYLSTPIMERAKTEMEGTSICAYCSRMKRGTLYTCCRHEGYNVLVLAQHLDDLAESFVMSAFHNGQLRTMKANYTIGAGDIRVIRPFVYTREAQMKKFSYEAKLPVINENCPACFEAPKERERVKKMLAQQESMIGAMYGNLKQALLPLMDDKIYESMQSVRDVAKHRGSRKLSGTEPGMKGAGSGQAPAAAKQVYNKLLGPVLMSNDGKKLNTAGALKNAEVVGLYFSAHWCPPCKTFTPELSKRYVALKEAGKRLEIVFVSSDETARKCIEYHSEMPFLALPFRERDRKDSLSEEFNVQGIPTLVLLDGKTGKVLNRQGRVAISAPTYMDDFPYVDKEEAEQENT